MEIEMIENEEPEECIHKYQKSPFETLICTKCGRMIKPPKPDKDRYKYDDGGLMTKQQKRMDLLDWAIGSFLYGSFGWRFHRWWRRYN